MADITPTDIAEAVAKQIPAFFNDAFDQFTQGEGGYLAFGEPEGIVAQTGQAVGRAACRRFGANPAGSTLVNSERFERACRPYLDSIEPGNGAGIEIPFEGGQCNQLYRLFGDVEYDIFIGNLGTTTRVPENVTTEYSILGPILGFSFRYDTPGPSGNRRWILDVNTASGLIQGVASRLNPISNNSVSGAQFVGTVEIQPGSTDNCGNPPFGVIQPKPQTDPTPPPFRFNPAPGLDIDIDADINPDGSITFDIGPGDITINPFPEDEGGGTGGGEPNPLPPGSQGDPGSPQDTTEGEAEDEDPTRYLVGVLVQTIARPPRAKARFNSTEAYYAGLYYVYMGGDEGLAQIPAALVAEDQFFYAPEGANRFRVIANQGVTLRATPYWRDVVESE